MEIRRYNSGAELFEAVGPMLLERECEHSLLMGLAGSEHAFEGCELAKAAWSDGEPAAALIQTSINEAIISTAPAPAARALGVALAEAGTSSRGVVGPADASGHAAEAFVERTGVSQRLERRLILHRLEGEPDGGDAGGTLRPATPRDAGLLVEWGRGFDTDTRSPAHARDPVRRVTQATDAGRLFVLESEGEPVAAASWSRQTRSTRTINFVYTPPEHRGRGLARAVTAALARTLIETGTPDVLIFTDADDPTPNRVYARVGFRPLIEFAHWAFEWGVERINPLPL